MDESSQEKEVVYAWPYLEWGGAQVYFFGLMKLVRESYRVTALMPQGSAPRLLNYLKQLEVPCEFFEGRLEGAVGSVAGRIKRRWRKFHFEWVLARRLGRRKLRDTILHLEIAPWSSFLLLYYLSLRSNVFVTLHTALPEVSTLRYVAWLIKFRLLDRLRGFHLITSNRDTLESLRPYLRETSLRRIPVAYSGVDLAEIQRALAAPDDAAELRRRFQLPAGAFLVFCLGQFIERKGSQVLLEAARELHDEHPYLFYVWVGTNELEPAAERQVAESGIIDRFRYISGQELGGDRQSLLTLVRAADMFVLPSLQEGLPIALLEAMALGRPCIASDINAIPEAIQDRQTGLLTPPNDGGALAETIAVLYEDAELRKRVAAAGQQAVLAQFNERLTAEITLDYYDTCWGH